MKMRKLFATLALSLFAFASVGAAFLAAPKASEVKADPEPWMTQFVLNANNVSEWGGIDLNSFRLKVWKDGSYESTVKDVAIHKLTSDNYYTYNMVFDADYSYDRIQFYFYQNSEAKYSAVENKAQDASSNVPSIYCSATGTWDSGAGVWNASFSSSIVSSYLIFDNEDPATHETYSFVPDFSDSLMIASSVVVTDVNLANRYGSISILGAPDTGWGLTYDVIRESSRSLITGNAGSSWFGFKAAGTYDFIFHNSYSDGGVVEIREHVAPVSTYIYYVTQADALVSDYIYSWGGSKQFTGFPGTPIASVVGVKDITHLGRLHFQGDEVGKRIYKIPVTIGYPTGDNVFEFNNGKSKYEEGGWESETFDLVAGAAYWYTGGANANAGLALDFFELAEDIRWSSSESHSVCEISSSNAAKIVNAYKALDADIKTTYINNTTVYTLRRDGQTGEELVSYRVVVEELAKKYNIPLEGNYVGVFGLNSNDSTALITTIVIVSLVAVSAVIVFVAVRKRKVD